MIDPNDPTFLHMRRYNNGRVTAFVNGKEFGPPEYNVKTHEYPRNIVADDYLGYYRSIGVTVTDAKTKELIVSFQTRVPVEVIK